MLGTSLGREFELSDPTQNVATLLLEYNIYHHRNYLADNYVNDF